MTTRTENNVNSAAVSTITNLFNTTFDTVIDKENFTETTITTTIYEDIIEFMDTTETITYEDVETVDENGESITVSKIVDTAYSTSTRYETKQRELSDEETVAIDPITQVFTYLISKDVVTNVIDVKENNFQDGDDNVLSTETTYETVATTTLANREDKTYNFSDGSEVVVTGEEVHTTTQTKDCQVETTYSIL